MNEVLKLTLSLSCSGALLIAIFHLFRPLIQARLSKQWQYYIWLVVVARLLLPFAPEANLMGMLFEQIDHGVSQVELAAPTGQTESPSQGGAPSNLPQDKAAQSGRSIGENQTSWVHGVLDRASALLQYIWLLWLMIALVLLIRKVTIYQSFVKYIRAGCVEVEEIELMERFGSLVAQSGIKTAVDLSVNPLIFSPLLIGFFRPCIVLPTTDLPDSDFQFTILHELTHFKRWDMFYKWLVQVTICIHWFNPFAYLMGREVERACELACDEAVIRALDATGRRAYGDTLMNAIGAGGRYKDSVSAVTLYESKTLLGERLTAITDFHQQSKFIRAISVVLAGVVCMGAVSVGAYSTPTPGLKPKTSGDLTLVTVEYTVEELTKSEVTTIYVQTLSDEIVVARGGDTVKFEYYAANTEEYSLKQTIDGLTQEEVEQREEVMEEADMLFNNTLSLWRIRDTSSTVGDRSISITVPEEFPLEYLSLVTTTGNIRLDSCTFSNLDVTTQTGEINMVGGAVDQKLWLRTESGDALISGTVLPVRGKGDTRIETRIGLITFQPLDDPYNYRLEIDYGDEATVVINQEYVEKSEFLEAYAVKNPDGSTTYLREGVKRINQFAIHEDGASVIYFNSPKGMLRLLGK